MRAYSVEKRVPALTRVFGASDKFQTCIESAHTYVCADGMSVVCVHCLVDNTVLGFDRAIALSSVPSPPLA